MPLPVQTPEQRQESLRKAAAARKERALALNEVRKGAVTVAAVLEDEDSPLQRVKVRKVLLAVPGIGDVRADRLMNDIGIDASRRIRGLGSLQRLKLAAALS